MLTFHWRRLVGKLVPYSFHPTLHVLFLITFTKTLPERLGLIRKFKGVSKGRCIGHWVDGVEEKSWVEWA